MSRDNSEEDVVDVTMGSEENYPKIVISSREASIHRFLILKLEKAEKAGAPFIVIGETGLAKIWRESAFPSDPAFARVPLNDVNKKLAWWKSAPSKAFPVILVGARDLGRRVTNLDITGRVQGRDRNQRNRQDVLGSLPIIGVMAPFDWKP